MLALALKSVMIWLFENIGGITGIFLTLNKVFTIDQYDYLANKGSFNLAPNLK